MKTLNEHSFAAFYDEVIKLAGFGELVAQNAGRLKNIGSLGGAGALVGATAGGVYQGAKGWSEARDQGAGVGTSAGHALQRAMGGALTGGVAGGLAGGVAGGLAKRDFSGLRDHNVLGIGSRFGQRQVHGLTGVLSPQELRGVRGGAHDAVRSLDAAIQSSGMGSPAQHKALNAANAAATAENMGLTSIPGYVGSLRKNGVLPTVKAGLKEQWATSPAMTALGVGLPAASIGMAALKPTEEGARHGDSRPAHVGHHLGSAAAGIASAAMPMGTGVLLNAGLSGAGRLIGTGVSKAIRPPPPNREPPETNGMTQPVEHVMSNSAMGHLPEVTS